MGEHLKSGDFDKLYNLVGLVNQSDPEQEYLKNAEKIFKYRYKLNSNNYNYLYQLLSQKFFKGNLWNQQIR